MFDFDEEGNLLGDVGKCGNPYGYVTGVQSVYSERETETTAKSDSALREGDTLEFPCDGYGYGGTYQDSFLPGAPAPSLTACFAQTKTAAEAIRFRRLFPPSFPPDPLAEEGLFVVQQLLLGLRVARRLLEMGHALGNILRHAQAPSVDDTQHIILFPVIPVHLV